MRRTCGSLGARFEVHALVLTTVGRRTGGPRAVILPRERVLRHANGPRGLDEWPLASRVYTGLGTDVTSASVSAMYGTLERSIGAMLCVALAVAWAAESAVPDPPASGPNFAPAWLPLIAAAIGVAGVLPLQGSPARVRAQRALVWTGLSLLVWAANGLPFDVLTAAGLSGRATESGEIVIATVWWPGLVTRAL